MNEKLLLAANPNSGDGIAKHWIYEMVSLLSEKYKLVTVYLSKAQGDIINTVSTYAKDYDAVICCGGDGTLNETLNGVYKSGKNIPVGYIPTGTTNDFASSHGIPKNIKAALSQLSQAEPHNYDMGKLGDKIFSYVAAFGAIIEVCYNTPQADKASFGRMAYLAEGAKKLQDLKPLKMKITCGERIIYGDFVFGMVTNSRSVGGFRNMIGRQIAFDDGLFEVTLIKRPKNPIELQEIIAALLIEQIDTKHMYTFKTGHITFESIEEIPWTLDGEFGGEHDEVVIDNLNKQLMIMVPETHVEELMEDPEEK